MTGESGLRNWLLVPLAFLLALASIWPTRTPREISGRVLDDRDGRPLAGVVVRQMRTGAHPVATTRTDARGAFVLPLQDGNEVTIELDARGCALVRDQFTWPRQALDLHLGEVRLTPAHTVRITVTDTEGKPVPGLALRTGWRSVVTDAAGQCRLERIPVGTHALTAQGAGPARAYITAGTPLQVADQDQPTEAHVSVAFRASIRGTLRDERGQPVGEMVQVHTTGSVALTMHDGRFELTPGDELPPVEVQLGTDATAKFESLHDPRPVRWGQEDVSLTLRARPSEALSLDLQVMARATGKPVPGYQVHTDDGRTWSVDNAEGRLRLDHLRPGWVGIRLTHDDPTLDSGVTEHVELRADRDHALRLQLAPRQPLRIQAAPGPSQDAWVHVVHNARLDEDIPSHGAADEARALVLLRDHHRSLGLVQESARLDQHGIASVRLQPGVQRAEVIVGSRLSPQLQGGPVTEATPVVPGEQLLRVPPPEPPGRVEGRMLPVPTVPPRLVLRRPGVGPLVTRLRTQAGLVPETSVSPDRFGFFTIERVPPGHWELHRSTSPLGGPPLALVRIAPGAATQVALDGTAFRAGRVEGRVLLDGAPAAGRTVILTGCLPSACQESRAAETDAHGRFAVAALPGDYALYLTQLDPGVRWHLTWHGLARATTACPVRAGATTRAEFAIERRSLTLTVRWQDGTPVGPHDVVLMFVDLDLSANQALDAQGECTFALAPAEPFALTVVTRDGAFELGRCQLDPGQRDTRRQLTLPQPRRSWR